MAHIRANLLTATTPGDCDRSGRSAFLLRHFTQVSAIFGTLNEREYFQRQRKWPLGLSRCPGPGGHTHLLAVQENIVVGWFYLHRDVTCLGQIPGLLFLVLAQLEFVSLLGVPRAEQTSHWAVGSGNHE